MHLSSSSGVKLRCFAESTEVGTEDNAEEAAEPADEPDDPEAKDCGDDDPEAEDCGDDDDEAGDGFPELSARFEADSKDG